MASIRKHGNKWQARITRRATSPLAKSFLSKSDAERWARQAESQLDQGNFVDITEARRTSIAEMIERYRVEVTPKKKGAKQEGYRLNVLKRSALSRLSLATTRSTDIAKYRDERVCTVASNTVKNELNTLSAIFEFAKSELGLITNNPCRGVKRPSPPRGRTRRLKDGEQSLLLSACQSSRAWYLTHIVLLALETGARLGELTALRWADVDLGKCVAHLRATKNGEDRYIPLSRTAVNSLSIMPRGIDGSVIPAQADSVKETFRSAVKRAGLQDLHFHDLRHEAVSRLFELGLNVMEVASISGHKTLQMLKRYTHLRPEELAKKLG